MLEELHEDVVLDPDGEFPLIVRPARTATTGSNVVEWAVRHGDVLRARLARHGAILFRGFALEGEAAFTALARSVSPDLHTEYGDLAPENPAAGVYGSTAYPEQHAIHFHNESAHAPTWPLYLFFLNQSAPVQGGATRLVNTRRVLSALDPGLRQRLRDQPITYLRNHHPHVDTSWQVLYDTDDPREVERRCREAGLACRWPRRDTLQTSVTLPSIVEHPVTGEEVLFHQLFLFHPACLDAATRAGLEAIYASDDLPRQVRWSSGEPIDDALVRDLFALYEAHTFDVRWQPGDAVMLDNALVAHGRERFTGHRKLLVSMSHLVAHPTRSASNPRAPGWSADARRAQLDPTAPMTREHHDPVPVIFRALARRTPGATAISQEGRRWSYRELEAQAHRTAAALRALRLSSGAAVGITGPRSFEVIAALLGTWMNGQVVVPVDVDLPTARKAMMLGDAAAAALLFAGETPAWFTGGARVDLNALGDAGGAQAVDVGPEHPAYVFFTSGSTGRPKGVTGTHAGLAHFLAWQRSTFAVRAEDRVAQLTGLSFDVVLRDIFLALTSGATLCLPPASLNLLDPWPWLRRERITRLHTVPSLASLWLQHAPAGAACETLATVFFAGEPLHDGLVRRWRAATRAEIVNLYGPTETTLAKCCFRVGDVVEAGVQPIGHPLPGVQVLIVNDAGAQCADGETGEIVIRTPYRTLGYLRPDASAGTRFAPNPFSSFSSCAAPDDIVYYTGDLGRVRPDGALDILGRKDDQLKVMGVRIEPQEVAAALARHPHVRQAFVAASAADPVSLVAYVVADAHAAPSAALRAFLVARLPAALIPHHFVHLAALPLTPAGKIDRKALPQPDAKPSITAGPAAATLSATERKLAALWCELLSTDAVAPDDDFLDLGGHSLLAMQLVARVRDGFGVALEIGHVFEHPTLAGLATCIGDLVSVSEQPGPAVTARSLDRRGPLPLSFAQQRLWFLSKLAPDQGVYNIPGAIRLQGTIDPSLLQRCVDVLVARHPSLRTAFIEHDGVAGQVIGESVALVVERRDLSAVPADRRTDEVRRVAREFTGQPFSLESAPLARLILIKEAEADHVLVYALHHTIADGWSNFAFHRELAQLYASGLDGTAILAPLPLDYLDFTVHERERFAEVGGRELAYWKTQLDGAPVCLDLPTDRPRPAAQTFHGASAALSLSPALTSALARAFRTQHATVFMKLLATFNVLLHELSGERDIVVGTPVARRSQRDLEAVIGCFINTLALRTRVPEGATFESLLEATRAQVLGAFEHQDAPFERVVEAVAPPRDPRHHPIFQVLFNCLHFDEPALATEGLSMRRESLVDPETKFDMTLYVRERRDQIHLHLVYNADLFDRARMQRLLLRHQALIEQCIAEPGRPLIEWTAPVTGGAQVTVAALARPPAQAPQPAAPAIEAAMREIWREVLGVDRVDRADDFFALGGHSLLATRLVARICDRFDCTLPLRSVFEHPTAGALARAVERSLGGSETGADALAPVLPPITRNQGSNGELSLDQSRLWQLHREGLDGHYYNVPRAVRLTGRLDLDALHASLRAVVRHQAALRTLFEDSPRGARVHVLEDQDLDLDLVDAADATASIDREARHRFDLGKRLPLRAALVRHGREDHTLIVTAHHIAADCWSLGLPFQAIVDRHEPWYPGIFFADLMAIYAALEARQPFPLAPLPVEFSDFARWQKARLESGDLAQHAAFWKGQLGDAPRTLDLPTDFPRGPRHSLAGARHEFAIPGPLAAQLERLRRDHRTTLFVPLLAAFGLAIERWSGQSDIVVGTPVANRTQVETRNLIGPVGNTVALRVRVDKREAAAGLIARLREGVARSFAHQEYPFSQLAHDLGAAGQTRPPLFQVRFVLQQAPDTLANLPHLAIAPVKIDRGVSKYDLSMIVAAQGRKLRGWCEFNTDLFRPSTIQGFAEGYLGILQDLVEAHAHDA